MKNKQVESYKISLKTNIFYRFINLARLRRALKGMFHSLPLNILCVMKYKVQVIYKLLLRLQVVVVGLDFITAENSS